MWLRFAWFINYDASNLVPHDLGDDGGMIWITEKYHNVSTETREHYCGYTMDLPLESSAPKCKFMFFEFEPGIINKGSGFEAGCAKFAIGLGLLAYFVLFWGTFVMKEIATTVAASESDNLAMAICANAIFSFWALFLVSQQSLVLLQLTNLKVSDYCAELE
eukprot:3450519-Rhodomonas_salina.1